MKISTNSTIVETKKSGWLGGLVLRFLLEWIINFAELFQKDNNEIGYK